MDDAIGADEDAGDGGEYDGVGVTVGGEDASGGVLQCKSPDGLS